MSKIKCPKCGEEFELSENDYNDIVNQINKQELDRQVSEQVKLLKEKYESDLKLATSEQQKDNVIRENELNNKINDLTNKLNVLQMQNKQNVEVAIKDKEIEITKLRSSLEEKTREYETALKVKEEEVERYKDMKLKLSTKLIGETLEQHCQNQFNQIRTTAFPNCYFDKDNDVSKQSNSKGDFIFKDFIDNNEYISIMFEMKNENDETATKHKNADFFKELDKDRREKKCEYAVLVSMLEPESELYNSGIVDVSYEYPKMYVVRPQNFITIITILANAAKSTIEYKNQLVAIQNENIDITNFKQDLDDMKSKIGRDVELAERNHNDAIERIDKTIKELEKVRDALIGSNRHLELANDKVQDLSVKKLTRNNPTMKARFEELEQNN